MSLMTPTLIFASVSTSSLSFVSFPAAAAVGAVSYLVIDLLGDGVAGTLLVAAALIVGCALLWRANRAQPIDPEETVSEHATVAPAARPEPVPA